MSFVTNSMAITLEISVMFQGWNSRVMQNQACLKRKVLLLVQVGTLHIPISHPGQVYLLHYRQRAQQLNPRFEKWLGTPMGFNGLLWPFSCMYRFMCGMVIETQFSHISKETRNKHGALRVSCFFKLLNFHAYPDGNTVYPKLCSTCDPPLYKLAP